MRRPPADRVQRIRRSLRRVRLIVFGAAAAVVLSAAVAGQAAEARAGARAGADPLPPSDSTGTVRHGSFTFATGTCEQGPEFCAIAAPRAWTPAESALVGAALDEIAANETGRRIIDLAVQNGFRTLRRFAHAAQPDAGGNYAPEPMIVATAHTDEAHAVRTIDLTDRFFERQTARDHFSGTPGYLLTTEILAHELVHGVDLNQQLSNTDEFRRVARLGMPTRLQEEADRVNVQREQLNAEGRYEASWQVSRAFGVLSLRGRLPSVQALDGYREAFAEFGAHLVLDPNARRRLEPRLIRYFEEALAETH
jgi:hypothetical protein